MRRYGDPRESNHFTKLRLMRTKQFVILSGVLAGIIASSGLTGCASSQKSTGGSSAAISGAKVKKVDFLFVQTAKGFAHGKGRITLLGVNPLTISFSDRPDRIAGHMPTSKFIPMWSQGADSFLSNPPNATLSVFRGDSVSSTSSFCAIRSLLATTSPMRCEFSKARSQRSQVPVRCSLISSACP